MLRFPLIGAACLALVACDTVYLPDTSADATQSKPALAAPSAESIALSTYYAGVQEKLLVRDLLRTDGGGPDVPFDARSLADNFIQLALFEEYQKSNGRIIARETPSALHRWEKPVRMKVSFSASISEDQQIFDRSNIIKFSSRLARITGVSIRPTSTNANFSVYVANKGELRALAPTLNPDVISEIENRPRDTSCLVARELDASGALTNVTVVIRGEQPDLLRLACIHEELTQGMGISNDSPHARPSIFNDDEEFALLTTHDEMLLRMLYDPRMRVGMNAAQARPQAEIIAREMFAGDS